MNKLMRIMCVCALALACACTDYVSQLDEIEKQLEELERRTGAGSGSAAEKESWLDALQLLTGMADAAVDEADAEKIAILRGGHPAPVFKVEEGRLEYSVDGAVSFQDAGLLDTDAVRSFTQDDNNYYFELAAGGVVTLPKARPSDVELPEKEVDTIDHSKCHIPTYVYKGVRLRHVNPAVFPLEVGLERYGAVVDAGVDIMMCDGGNVWDNDAYYDEIMVQLDLAEKVGLKIAVVVDCYLADADYPEGHPDRLRRMVELVKDHPALWGYQLYDEPSADLFKSIGSARQVISEIDPVHPCLLNLLANGCATFGPVGSYHTDTYDEYLERCMNEAHPDFLSFDAYPCRVFDVMEYEWYSTLEQIADRAKANGIDFWAFAATCRIKSGVGMLAAPSVATLRLQDYTHLAYGAQGLEYFTWAAQTGDFADWVVDVNGDINTTNPTFECLQFVNREVQRRAFVFDGCDVKWAGHYHDVPRTCRAVDDSMIPGCIESVYTQDCFVMSLLENDGGDSEYFCIVSRTHLKPTSIRLRLKHPVQTVERDGSLKTYFPGDHDFTIDPGDILIIKTK